ncbi:DUF4833 domain-containing protein [Sinomicrobium soli]|uniref:DUF4833 domain-containing protein n=1 Tax=Sinomicrobium sp. N-1-3-6 TaxID=2219864 RepID=UPI000DCC0835|nr:DUF4833 domain-containing protein [Sinomicrobium sp. N-1-3-6]RAV27745.1 DUF4833 domain-containing protein [Sinomicrobium sp. N-1-3-6]
MKIPLFLYSLFLFISILPAHAQADYPVPEATPTRLFYIQHSNNHNTYVYDARMDGNRLDNSDPVEEYRIVYTQGGIKKPLNLIQKKLAYGMVADLLEPGLFELHLAASKKPRFYLTLDAGKKPEVYLTVNDRKMYLDRMFVQLRDKTSDINAKADYVLFEGRDFKSGRNVTEKVVTD